MCKVDNLKASHLYRLKKSFERKKKKQTKDFFEVLLNAAGKLQLRNSTDLVLAGEGLTNVTR